jgi:hypothetical protein
MSGANPSDAGVASGLFNTTQQIGGALGVAVLSTLATTRTSALRASGDSAASALTGGFHLAFAIATGLLAAAFILAVTILRQPENPAPPQTTGTADEGAVQAMSSCAA